MRPRHPLNTDEQWNVALQTGSDFTIRKQTDNSFLSSQGEDSNIRSLPSDFPDIKFTNWRIVPVKSGSQWFYYMRGGTAGLYLTTYSTGNIGVRIQTQPNDDNSFWMFQSLQGFDPARAVPAEAVPVQITNPAQPSATAPALVHKGVRKRYIGESGKASQKRREGTNIIQCPS